jgi:hypothetical protein
VNGLFEEIPQSCGLVDCESNVYLNPPNLFAFTTTTATADQAGQTLSVDGARFDCANFTVSGSGGMLAAPAPMHSDFFGSDMAAVLRFSETP